MQKTAKKQSPVTIIVGAIALFAAALIIFLSIALPRIRENRIFYQRYDALITADYTLFLLSDPLYKTGEAIESRGVEVSLSAEQVFDLRTRLRAVRESGIKNGENLKEQGGAWDVRLQLRTTSGERAELYFAETEMYFYADGCAFTFQAKDAVAYEGLYHSLQTVLKANG